MPALGCALPPRGASFIRRWTWPGAPGVSVLALAQGSIADGECCSSRVPVGRRGQGQDRRLAVRAGRYRRPLPGRSQCRPHFGDRWRHLQVVAAALRRGARGKLSIIGNGVVVDPQALIDEIAQLKKQGVAVTPDNLRIAENAPLILPLHRELEAVREADNSATRIGTTKRGIGPAYEDKVGRRAIRFMDLADLPALAPKIERLLAHHNALRRGLGLDELDGAAIYQYLAAIAPQVLPFMDSVWSLLDAKRREGKRILFEGAQGALLDIDHGTYPYVTSSNTVAAQAATGSGLGPNAIDYVLGICKAYTTRVGEGPFPTDQMHNATGKTLGERGREFGTVTGRARRA